jgi:hypothetical protein
VLSVCDTELHPLPALLASLAPAPPLAHSRLGGSGGGSAAAFTPPPPFSGEERLELVIDIAGVGLSIVGTTEELLYASLAGVRIVAAQSRLEQTLHAAASRLQVDNTLRRTASPVMLSCGRAEMPWAPLGAAAAAAKDAAASAMRRVEERLEREIGTTIGTSIGTTALPLPLAGGSAAAAAPDADAAATGGVAGAAAAAAAASADAPRARSAAISLAFARWRRRPGGVVCIREALLDLAPLSLELDDELIEALPAAAEALWRPHRDRAAAAATSAAREREHAPEDKLYIERLRVSPLALRLTARRLPFAPRGVKALAGVEGAALELPALELAHPLLRASALGTHAARHYQRAALAAVTTLLGSASLLGDPIGLAAALRRAAWRLLHGSEPDDTDGGAAAGGGGAGGAFGGGGAAPPRGARRFALDLLFAVSDAVRKVRERTGERD